MAAGGNSSLGYPLDPGVSQEVGGAESQSPQEAVVAVGSPPRNRQRQRQSRGGLAGGRPWLIPDGPQGSSESHVRTTLIY